MKTLNLKLDIKSNWVDITDQIDIATTYLISSRGVGCVLQYYVDDTTPPTDDSIGHTVTNEAVGGATNVVQLRAVAGDRVYMRAVDIGNLYHFRGDEFRLDVILTSLG